MVGRRSAEVLGVAVVAILAGCAAPRRGGAHPSEPAAPEDGGLARSADATASGPDAGRPTSGDAGGSRDAGRVTGPVGTPAHIEIYSGNGMVVTQGWPSGDAMKVLVTDEAGAPVAGVAVLWEVLEGGAALTGDFATGSRGESLTDELGLARAGVRGEFLSGTVSAVRARFRASIPSGEVEFHALSTYYDAGLPSAPEMYIESEARDLGTLAPGEIVPAGIVSIVVFQAGSERGRGAEGVGMRVVPDDAWSDLPPPVSCANASEGRANGGTVFTDATGHARCDLRAPAAPGFHTFGVRLGGARDFSPFSLRVE